MNSREKPIRARALPVLHALGFGTGEAPYSGARARAATVARERERLLDDLRHPRPTLRACKRRGGGGAPTDCGAPAVRVADQSKQAAGLQVPQRGPRLRTTTRARGCTEALHENSAARRLTISFHRSPYMHYPQNDLHRSSDGRKPLRFDMASTPLHARSFCGEFYSSGQPTPASPLASHLFLARLPPRVTDALGRLVCRAMAMRSEPVCAALPKLARAQVKRRGASAATSVAERISPRPMWLKHTFLFLCEGVRKEEELRTQDRRSTERLQNSSARSTPR